MNTRISIPLPSKANPFRPLLILAVVAIVSLRAWAAAAAAPKITPTQTRAAAEEIAQLIEDHYVFPDKRQGIANAIRRAASDHWYDVDDPYVFADRITTQLRGASNDAHLAVIFHPDQPVAPGHNAPSVPPPNVRSEGQSRNEGFEELKILPGNIRYAKITNFMWTPDVTAPVIDEVARFLGEGNAVIIDLRGNGGGNASAVARLISYFMKNDDQVLMTFYDGMSGDVEVSRVKDDLRAPRMVGKPLYTLIDDGTASAAEEFAYHVQQFKLGSLVGEKTAGAANNNQHFPVKPGFIVSVSIGRPVHPVSKTNWEQAGIVPTDPVPATSALEQAELLALRRLAEKAPEAERKVYSWAIQGIEARLHPLKLAAPDLEPYSGKYGIRTIRVDNGTLVFQREGRSPTKLIPMAPDLFASARTDEIRVKFRRSGNRVIGFDQITDDGQIIPSERDN